VETVKKVVAVEKRQMWNPQLLCLVRQSEVLKLSGDNCAPTRLMSQFEQTWNMWRKLLFMHHTQSTRQTSLLS
jgi:hypothetical protein